MRWTNKKPTTPGWYWYRDSPVHQATVEKVFEYWLSPPHGGRFVLSTTSQLMVKLMNGQWSSEPIAPPEEA